MLVAFISAGAGGAGKLRQRHGLRAQPETSKMKTPATTMLVAFISAGAGGAGKLRQRHGLRAQPGLGRIGDQRNGSVPQAPIRRPDRFDDTGDQVFAGQFPEDVTGCKPPRL
jgi:hypothetical protein